MAAAQLSAPALDVPVLLSSSPARRRAHTGPTLPGHVFRVPSLGLAADAAQPAEASTSAAAAWSDVEPKRIRGIAVWGGAGEIHVVEHESANPISTHLLGAVVPHAAAPVVLLGPERRQQLTFLAARDEKGEGLFRWAEVDGAVTRTSVQLSSAAASLHATSTALLLSFPSGAHALYSLALEPMGQFDAPIPARRVSVLAHSCGKSALEVVSSLPREHSLLITLSCEAPAAETKASKKKGASAEAAAGAASIVVQHIGPQGASGVLTEISTGLSPSDIVASCASGRFVTLLTRTGELRQIELLAGLGSRTTSLQLLNAPAAACMLAINSFGTVLLYSASSLSLISPPHGAVLAATDLDLPAALSTAAPDSALVSRIGGGALLALNYASGARAVLFVPAAAHNPSLRWATSSVELTRAAIAGPHAARSSAHAAVAALRSVATDGSAMDEAWAHWVRTETARLKKSAAEEQAAAAGQNGTAPESDDSEGDEDAPAPPQHVAPSKARALAPHLTHDIVSAVLALALPAQSDGPYARKTVQYLLMRRAVSERMTPAATPSVVTRLLALGDWETALSAARLVPDVSEQDLTALLTGSLRAQTTAAPRGSTLPHLPSTLPFVLSALAAAPLSTAVMRTELRRAISDAAEVHSILAVLNEWLRLRARLPFSASIAPEAKKGALPGRKKKQNKDRGADGASVPRLEQLVALTTLLLDAYFPLLLQTPSTHALLASLGRSLSLHLAACSQLSTLRGPLAAFARLEADTAALREKEAAGRALRRQRGLREAKAARQSAAVGVSETGGGLGAQPERSARSQKYEASALVGPYVAEALQL